MYRKVKRIDLSLVIEINIEVHNIHIKINRIHILS